MADWRKLNICSSFDFRNALDLFSKDGRKNKINKKDKQIKTNSTCSNGCCVIKKIEYVCQNNKTFCFSNKNLKAGALLYDKNLNSVLLVQSAGNFFGLPKGSKEENETDVEAAIREVFEETGIKLDKEQLGENYYKPYKNQTYFFIEIEQSEVEVQESEGNDANGITWIKLECLKKEINNGKITLNKSSNLVLDYFISVK
jgi:ADP-ribose pyrophosphatase YjhB (NUDIX family)